MQSDVDPGRARQITTVDSGAIVFLERASLKFLDHTTSIKAVQATHFYTSNPDIVHKAEASPVGATPGVPSLCPVGSRTAVLQGSSIELIMLCFFS
jgi:hypothetical protein